MARFASGAVTSELTEAERQAEEAADEFAAALLLPKAMLLRAAEKIGDEAKTAEFFDVSKGVLRRRLELVSGREKETPANFIAAEDRLTHRKSTRGRTPDHEATSRTESMQIKESKLPRSFAARTYGNTAKATGGDPKDKNEEGREQRSPGLEKLRQLARQIDPSV